MITLKNKYMNILRKKDGFTIVELLIVIVVIGILAAIITVSYAGIQKNAVSASMKTTLRSAATKMKATHVATDSYPQTFPADFKAPADMGLVLTTVSSVKEFCINITHKKYADLKFSINQNHSITEGHCTGSVIVASAIGEYTFEDLPVSAARTVEGSPVTANGTPTGFKIQTDEAWSRIVLSWNAIPSATRYEVQTREPGGTWYNRASNTGAGSYTPSDGGGTSGVMGSNVLTVTWTSTLSRPTTAGQTHEYRHRAYVSGVAGDWSDASLTVPSDGGMGSVRNLTVVPNAQWSAIAINWEVPNGLGSPADVLYELQTRDPGGTWYARATATGSGAYSGGGGTSGSVALTTTSYNWTNTALIPSTAGGSHEFRIRIKSNTTAAIYGPWLTVTITAPTDATLPAMSSLTVVPDSAAYNNVTISWSGPAGFGTPSDFVYELLTRGTDGVWYGRALSSGSGGYAPPAGGGTSGSIALTATPSLTWTHANAKPAAGQTHDYRIRVKSSANATIYGPWTTTSLTR